MTKHSDILFEAADAYEAQGVSRTTLFDAKTGRCCARGIIAKVATGDPHLGYEIARGRHGESVKEAIIALDDHVANSNIRCGGTDYSRAASDIIDVNDIGRTNDGRLFNAKSIAGVIRKAARNLRKAGR